MIGALLWRVASCSVNGRKGEILLRSKSSFSACSITPYKRTGLFHAFGSRSEGLASRKTSWWMSAEQLFLYAKESI